MQEPKLLPEINSKRTITDSVVTKVVKEKRVKGSKDAEITALLTRKSGCTSEEVLRVTGWPSVSMPAMAKKLGLALRIEKGTKPFRYYGEEK